MDSPAELYVNGVKDKLRIYFAAWLPTSQFALGDVGVLDGNLFQRLTSLTDLGIAFDELPAANSSELDVVSGDGVSISFKIAGETNAAVPTVPKAAAGIGVEFGREGAFVIKATEAFESQIRDIASLQQDVIEAFKSGVWKPNWAVVVKVVKATHALILVSRSAHASLEFSATGDVPVGAMKLGDAKVNLQVMHQSGDIVRVDGSVSVTPLFQLARIHRRLLRDPELRITKAIEPGFAQIDESLAERARTDPRMASSLYLDLIQD